SLSHQHRCLARPRSPSSSPSLYHSNLRRDSLVEYHMVYIRYVQTLLSYARGYQNVVFAISKVFENLHLFTLTQTQILAVSIGLPHKPDRPDGLDHTKILDNSLYTVPKLCEHDNFRMGICPKVLRYQLSKSLLFWMRDR